MKIDLHLALEACGADALQSVLEDRREKLAAEGILYPSTPGTRNHLRLYLIAMDDDHIDPYRHLRDLTSPYLLESLRKSQIQGIEDEIKATGATRMILSSYQLATGLTRRSEIERLRDLLLQFGDDIRITLHVDEQARVLRRHFITQLLLGRETGLEAELSIAAGDQPWNTAARAMWPEVNHDRGQVHDLQSPPFWLDYEALIAEWEAVFGAGSIRLAPFVAAEFQGPNMQAHLNTLFDLPSRIGRFEPEYSEPQLSHQTAAHVRALNAAVMELHRTEGKLLPPKLIGKLRRKGARNGPALMAGQLAPVSEFFAAANARLIARFPDLAQALTPDAPLATWSEPEKEEGYKPALYFKRNADKIDKFTRETQQKKHGAKQALKGQAAAASKLDEEGVDGFLSDRGREFLDERARKHVEFLVHSRFPPHNQLGSVDQTEMPTPLPATPRRELPAGSTGNVVVACMKNEGPYILEWIAYHRAIGFDNFLIYTNACEDGTVEVLDRLQAMGILTHESNDDWSGQSPQQHALNNAVEHPLLTNAEWIAHFDVDEFVNIHAGDGTLPALFEAMPEATNITLTWRLMGNAGVQEMTDDLVIDQFRMGAPKFCPKPHNSWGFKTLYKNLGAYEKLSCHRPNKLKGDFREQVRWFNGSGDQMHGKILDNGWRSNEHSIGYDLVQLNHYALRSAEGFLVKRQRGRALHVDQSIGTSYWVRMDFNSYPDNSILRNLERTREEYDRLLADPELAALHRSAFEWHKAKIAELKANPEFAELYDTVTNLDLNDLERVAVILANEEADEA